MQFWFVSCLFLKSFATIEDRLHLKAVANAVFHTVADIRAPRGQCADDDTYAFSPSLSKRFLRRTIG